MTNEGNGGLDEILEMDIVNDDHARGLFVAALNAVMNHLGLAERTIHCKNKEPEACARQFVDYIRENYGNPKIALVGYQPAILENLSKEFNLRVLDLNPENIGSRRYGVTVEDGIEAFDDAVINWAELVLCTGSTICNGSIVNFMSLKKEVLYYGTTLAGTAELLGLKRACFCSC